MPLSCWCYLLGLICLLPGVAVALAPERMAHVYKAFPRSKVAGMVISTVAWIWAGYAVWAMGLDFLRPFLKYLPVVVLVCIPLTWFWLDNLLPCRALGGILVLFPYELLRVARAHASPWRLLVVTFAYICIVEGMILLLYPWKLRQAIDWCIARPTLFRICGVLTALLGLLLIVVGATALRC